MGEQYLTWAEIEKKYPNEWVIIDRPTINRRSRETAGGYVVFHSPNRDERDAFFEALKPGQMPFTATRYIGPPLLIGEDEVWVPQRWVEEPAE